MLVDRIYFVRDYFYINIFIYFLSRYVRYSPSLAFLNVQSMNLAKGNDPLKHCLENVPCSSVAEYNNVIQKCAVL